MGQREIRACWFGAGVLVGAMAASLCAMRAMARARADVSADLSPEVSPEVSPAALPVEDAAVEADAADVRRLVLGRLNGNPPSGIAQGKLDRLE